MRARGASPSTSPRPAASIASHVVIAAAERRAADRLERLLADRPRGDVDDPLEADAVGVAAQGPQVREGVLDLAAAVEPRAADELVPDPVAEERFLDRPGLGVHPVHHRDVASPERAGILVVRAARQQRAAAADQALDLTGDPLRLLLLVVRLEALDLHAARSVGPELLVGPLGVAGHDGMGGVEDQLRRAVVPLQLHDGRVGIVALEVEDVPDVRAAPAIDRLVVVTDDREVPVPGRERPDPQVLRPVRVLVLVDVEVPPALLVASQHVGRRLEQLDRLEEQVVEVQPADLPQPGLVPNGKLRDRPLVEVDRVLAEKLRVEHLVLGPADRAEDGARPELPGEGQILLPQELFHERPLVLGVVDDESAIDPDRFPVAPEHPRAERVERARLHVPTGLADQADDPLAELTRSAVGERDREDRPWPDLLDPDEIGDPVGQDASLARARTREDQQRAIDRRDRPRLLGIQVSDDLALAGRGPRVACLALGRITFAPRFGRQILGEVRRARRVVQPVRLLRRSDGRRCVLHDVRPVSPASPKGRRRRHRRAVDGT